MDFFKRLFLKKNGELNLSMADLESTAGHNYYSIIAINCPEKLSIEKICEKLRIEIIEDEEIPLWEAARRDEELIGVYDNIILIKTSNPFDFFMEDDDFPEFILRIINEFNNCKIGASYYYSVVDQFGYSYFENGKRIRTRFGSNESGKEELWVNLGEKMDIEKENKSTYQITYCVIEKVTGLKANDLFSNRGISLKKFKETFANNSKAH